MTTGNGTNDPRGKEPGDDARPQARTDTPRTGGGNAPSRSGAGTASTAYEVATALRAQAARAAQATRGAATRLQESVGGTTARGANGTSDASAKTPEASADTARRQPPAPPPAATAARPATKPPVPVTTPGQNAAANAQAAPSTSRAQKKAPVPPPSLVAQQQAAAAAAAPPAAPLPPVDVHGRDGFDPAPTQSAAVARPDDAAQRAAARAAARRPVRVRKARLRLMRVDPWSVMKTSFLLSVALGVAMFVAVAVLWSVLDAAGVFDSVGGLVRDVTAGETTTGVDIDQYIELSRVLGFTTLIAVIDVVIITAIATLGAFLYNLSASLLGGLELTLAEDD